jgi:hypothetical protein
LDSGLSQWNNVVQKGLGMKDIGTVRWFGKDWYAPINDPRAEVSTPVGVPCERCSDGIEAGDQGVLIPKFVSEGVMDMAAFHLNCFLTEVGAL